MRFIILILTSIALFSCKKGTAEFHIKGQVSDDTFSGALTGATLRLYKIEAGSLNESLIKSAVIDNSGAYSFTFERDKAESYRLELSKSNYFSVTKEIAFSSLTTEEDNIVNISSTAKSWVDLHFVHNNGLASDELTFIKQEGKQDCDECCGTSSVTLIGNIDTTIRCINDGNTTYSFLWTYNNGSPAIESITTTPFDTVELLLNY